MENEHETYLYSEEDEKKATAMEDDDVRLQHFLLWLQRFSIDYFLVVDHKQMRCREMNEWMSGKNRTLNKQSACSVSSRLFMMD